MTLLPVAARWFERSRVDEATTLITEPHVIALMRCNVWHVRGATMTCSWTPGWG
jgi:hypothetical protein